MPPPIPSPLQRRRSFGELAGEMMTRGEFRDAFRRAVELIQKGREELDERITNALQAIEASLNRKIDARLAQVKDGKPGAKGDKGDAVVGPQGLKGDQGAKGEKGEKGEPASALDPKAIARMTIPEVFAEIDRRIPLLGDALRFGLEQHATDYLRKLDYGGGAVLAVMQSGALKVQQANTLNFKGAGAPTVTVAQNGVTHLDFPSPGSLSLLTATGAVDDSNVAFTFLSKPQIIHVNGSGYRENHGWAWNSGTLTATLDNPVGTGGDIYGI